MGQHRRPDCPSSPSKEVLSRCFLQNSKHTSQLKLGMLQAVEASQGLTGMLQVAPRQHQGQHRSQYQAAVGDSGCADQRTRAEKGMEGAPA
jgi:hypothetical protein